MPENFHRRVGLVVRHAAGGMGRRNGLAARRPDPLDHETMVEQEFESADS
jgi:hypothetical protein